MVRAARLHVLLCRRAARTTGFTARRGIIRASRKTVTTFAEDTGYGGDDGFMPGVSVFQKKNGQVVRVSDTGFGPGDIYCTVWHLFDLLPQGADGWKPNYSY